MNEYKELPVGEKYLYVQILGDIKLRAYKNKEKKEDSKQPDFKGEGIAVWINTKKEKKTEGDIFDSI